MTGVSGCGGFVRDGVGEGFAAVARTLVTAKECGTFQTNGNDGGVCNSEAPSSWHFLFGWRIGG
ncbi:MAG: hypothetical protein WA209_02510 [Candidatus Acidiferrales bacterium]